MWIAFESRGREMGDRSDWQWQAGLQRALPLRRSGEELSVTILASPDDHSSRLNWNVSAHLPNYVARSPPSPAPVAMLGCGRALPLTEYSAWSSARESLEKAKPVGASEILLSNDGDGLLEGSVQSTNFFAVAMNPAVEVQTAALGDGVLPGVIRQLVLEVCEEDGNSYPRSDAVLAIPRDMDRGLRYERLANRPNSGVHTEMPSLGTGKSFGAFGEL